MADRENKPTRRPSRTIGDMEALASEVQAGERGALARAITLVESRKPADRAAAQALLERLLPATGGAIRIGLSGVPGAGKSTLIDALGSRLTAAGHRLAVLAVDPSSGRSGGSILGDKTRMARLSTNPDAFIRPSPAGGLLGGVARATRESLLLCEAAGFDVVIVETVGAGQSEYAVADMVDVFVLLLLAGGGDRLQGIKKGALELADILAVNKADADPDAARHTAADYQAALKIILAEDAVWRPPILQISARTETGLDALWRSVTHHRELMQSKSLFEDRRRKQRLKWMQAMLEDRLLSDFAAHPGVRSSMAEIERAVEAGEMSPTAAAERLFALYRGRERDAE